MKNPVYTVLNNVITIGFNDLKINEILLDHYSCLELNHSIKNQKEAVHQEDLIEKIFIEEESIIAYQMKTNASNLRYTFPNYLKEQISSLPSISLLDENNASPYSLLNRIRAGKHIQYGEKSALEFQELQSHLNVEKGLKLSEFLKDVYCIESEQFSEFDIRIIISEKALRPIYTELRRIHGNDVQMFKFMKVEKMYFKNALFIACKIKHIELGNEFFCWTEEYQEQLSCRDFEYNRNIP